MIGLIACRSNISRELISFALRDQGFRTWDVTATEHADFVVESSGCSNCVLVIEADLLPELAGGTTWEVFLRSRPQLPVVVISLARVGEQTRSSVERCNAVLLEDPFDAAAVARAAARAGTSLAKVRPGARQEMGRSA